MVRSVRLCAFRIALLCALLLAVNSNVFSQNPIVTENALPGNPKTEWDVSGSGDPNIQGFATDMSVNKGQTVRFKIDVNGGGTYTIRIYRLGYYQGNGARLITNLGTFTAVNQPEPVTNTSTGWIDCGNWSESASWAVPASAVSGVYIARLTRSTGSSHIVFVVRDDAGNSPVLFKTSDATWQAYNGYGGNSLYVGATSYPSGHAVKVSYNRPFVTRDGGAGGGPGEDWMFNAEYPMIRFLERNGYNVSYTTDVDMERSTLPLTPAQHKVFLSVGHDEYWSATARTRIENARAAGVHLAFFSGNEVYWKTRWEDNNRTLVCYKEGTLGEINCGTKCDPNAAWTGLWRDGCAYPGAGACKPENSLTGQISWTLSTSSIQVPGAYRNYRFWRNTSVATQGANQTTTLPNGTLGYEWDYEQYPEAYPNGRIILSSTTLGGLTHKLSLYRHSSGALVFGAGTVQWSWGLDNIHDRGSAAPSTIMQQATVNLFADMGVQPGSLMAGLVSASASTDAVAPSVTISSPVHNATVNLNSTITISGTATDASGVVAGIEVSTDGGNTWVLATGTTSWSYSWTPTASGTASIRVRGFDDSGNMSVPGAAGTAAHISLNVSGGTVGSGSFTVFQPSAVPQIALENDGSAITLGMKFRSSQNGFVTGIRYYKGAGTTGTHTGTMWSATGTRLAEIVFSNETASGWQQAMLNSPVAITANTTYIVSYHSSSGDYCSSNPYFTAAVVNGPLRGLSNGEDGANGLYVYSSTPTFPASNYGSSNYFVDVVFTGTADTQAPLVQSVLPAAGATNISLNAVASAVFNEDMQAGTINNTTIELRDAANNLIASAVSYNSTTRTATLSPQSALANLTNYTVRILSGASGVKDLAGNPLAANYTWSFTTVPDQTAPTVSSVEPTPGANLVGVNSIVSGIFSEPMNPSSVNGSTIILVANGGAPVAATVTYNAAYNGFALLPSSPLSANTLYTATILGGASGVKDAAGNALAANYTWNFTTEPEPDLVAPQVVSVIPALNAVAQPTNVLAQVLFNEDMALASMNENSVQMQNAANELVPVTISYNSANRTMTITPQAALANATAYTIFLRSGTNGVKDLSGNSLAADYSWSFTTVADLQAPVVNSSTPAAGASSVLTTTSVTAQFSEPVDPASINGTTVELRDAASALVNATISYNAATRTVTLQPATALLNGTTYSFIIKGGASGVKDLAGNALANNFAINFSTVSAAISIFPSTSTPAVFENDGTALSLGMKFRSTQAGNILGVRFYKAPGDNTVHTGNLWSATGTKLAEVIFTNETASGWQQALFNTPVAILANTTYVVSYHTTSGNYGNTNPSLTAAITNGPLRALANGEDGPNGLYRYTTTPAFPNSNYGSSNYFVDVLFSTGPAPDQTAPIVTAALPAAGSTGVSLNPAMSVTFNEAMSFASISSSTIELRNPANQLVPATISYDAGTRTAGIAAQSALSLNTVYRIVVRSGANGVKDAAGNPLAADFTSSFTTLSDQTAPGIVGHTPANGAINISPLSSITVTFTEPIDPASLIAANLFVRPVAGSAVAASIQYNAGNNTATLQPAAALTRAVVYEVVVKGLTGGIRDLAGNPLAKDSVWQFTVEPDLVAPQVVSVSPVDGAINVARSFVGIISFNEAMNLSSLQGANVRLLAPGNISVPINRAYNESNFQLRIESVDSLSMGVTYTIVVAGGTGAASDLAGNVLSSEFSSSFTVRPDLEAPFVVISTPAQGATGVSINAVPVIRFSEAIDPASFNNGTIALLANGSVPHGVDWLYNDLDYTFTFQPIFPLSYSTSYTLNVLGGVNGIKDMAGNTLTQTFSLNFTTLAEPDLLAPQIVSLSPIDAATDVQLNSPITINFSEPLDPASVQASQFGITNSSGNVPFAVNYEAGTNVVTLMPGAALLYNSTYSISVSAGTLRDPSGNLLSLGANWSFTTIADLISPTVTSTVPAADASLVAIDQVITINFSEPVAAGTVSPSAFTFKNAVGNDIAFTVVQVLPQVVEIRPAQVLDYNTNYTFNVLSGVNGIQDLNNNPMSGNFEWSFTTAAFVDVLPPQVTATTPAANATGISISSSAQVVFNEDMEAGSINTGAIELSTGAGTVVPSTISYNNTTRTATLIPNAALSYSTSYQVTVRSGAAGVKDLAGNYLSADFTWNFTTVADLVPPGVEIVSPVNTATGIPVGATASVQFTEDLQPGTVLAAAFSWRDAANNVVPFTISYNATARTATLQPAQPLLYGTLYSLQVLSGVNSVKDLAGNGLSSNYNWSFTTEADLVAPAISSVSPANNTTAVPVSAQVTALFSEAMDAVSINSSNFELRNSANVLVSGTVTYNNSTRTVSFTPSASLSTATVFIATVKGGASGVKDLAGNPLASDYVWTFTTVNPSISIFTPTTVPAVTENDGTALTLGMKFRSTTAGFVTAIRYYKPVGATGTHTGNLWSSTGTKLAEVIFTNETASGWQQANLNTAIAISPNTTYVVSYHSPSGEYVNTNPYFTSAVVNGPLRALANGEDGGNGLYRYTSTPQFPNSTYGSSNYFVDVVFATNAGPDLTAPAITSLSPAAGANAVSIATAVTASFTETINPSSVTSVVFELRDAANNLVPAVLSVLQNQATLTPQSALSYGSLYRVTLRGTATGVRDLAGNAMLRDTVWTFTTADPPPPPITGNGPGGPILVLYSPSNPFSRYPIEILRAEGMNYFLAKDIAELNAADLNNYDVVVIGEVAVNSNQVTALNNWVNAGGTLIAMRPDAQLSGLLGITKQTGTLSNQYLLINTASGPGQGLVNQTIQFHGTADLYSLSGASSLATLYSSATASTSFPAVTQREVGTQGGKAIAFTYDLARSIVYTRQGNPAWAGQKRDGTSGPIRSDDLFFGGSSPDWVNLNKVAIPQADEQQRLLVNIIMQGNMHRKPLPRFWFLPSGHKAAIVMTGDDHANDGTTGRFNQYLTLGPNTAQDIADWKSIRGTSYIYNNTPISNAEATAFQNQGFEISLHLNTGCENYTPTSFNTDLTAQLAQLANQLPGLAAPVSHRTHCLVWSDWATTAKVQAQKGIRLDVNYYYWPGTWVQNRSGMFTGSGMPMRFADLDGSLIDCYQATTQMTDESGISLPQFNDQLLDRALGTEGYYGVFVANMHTDTANHIGSNRIISSALARNVPVISAKQLLTWLDGRNNSFVGAMSWSGNQLSFPVTALAGARNLRGMVPMQSASGSLSSISRNGNTISYTTQTIKGMAYAFFDIPVGTSDFVASYGSVANRGGSEPAPAEAPIVANSNIDEQVIVKSIKVEVTPNPSSAQFRLQVLSEDRRPVLVRIMDITGAMLERHEQVTPGQVMLLGSNWKNGTYFAEIIQGDQKRVAKLLKL